ncbi:terminase large subunit domain-containing protein [Shinella sp.]|uniref:terminase large subunit domain-containing protein n=1 Tax=Shinella sp. TaxID=1870904 RepID=UPI004035C70E
MADKEQQIQELRKILDTLREDIPLFAQFVFGATLSPKQIEFCEAWRTKRTITFRGGTSLGKSFIEAVVFWHSLVCLDHVQVSIFGPSEPQLQGGVWKQIQQLHDKMHPMFKDAFEVGSRRATRKINPSNCFGEYRLASGDRPDNARGIHAYSNYVIVDEATGIDDEVFTGALLNVLSDPDGKLCLVSNPSKASGFFFRTHLDPDISASWTQVHGTLYDSPNYNPETFEQLAKNYGGPTSRQYRCMVMGEFPLSDVDGLINREFIDAAVLNEDCVPADNVPVVWGLDPAGAGKDASVLCVRHDNTLVGFHEWQGLEPTPLAYKIRELYEKAPKKERPAVISIDATGLGNGVYSILKDWGLPVHACIFAGTPTRSPDRYSRIRDQLWWEMREWIHSENVSIPNHQRLIEELATPTYEDGSGKIKLEDKKAIKKRLGGRSPDYADALAISFAVSKTRFASKWNWSKPIVYDNLQSFE